MNWEIFITVYIILQEITIFTGFLKPDLMNGLTISILQERNTG